MRQPVFRFAPSPNGRLHLGHAYSALLNERLAKESGGRLLLRIEDIDRERCTAENVARAMEDLRWLEIAFEEPVLHQSSRMPDYRDAVVQLMELGLLYVCTCSRKTLADHAARNPEAARDPEGQPLYPGTCRRIAHAFNKESILRLDMQRALQLCGARTGSLAWSEKGGTRPADPSRWGDVIIARKGIGTSYHLAVVVDDAWQDVTDVVRGEDLLEATAIHRLLQVLLGLPEPRYHHHALIRHGSGRKLAKSKGDESLADLRAAGMTATEIRATLGFA
jgi:glutamyl-Q tRNA(Asp) synthetase